MARKKQGEASKPPLAILGTAGSLGKAPFEDESFEIWGVSPVLVKDECKRVDTVFEMHPRRYWRNHNVLERLNSHDGPVVMQDHFDEIPNSEPYPYTAVRNQFYLPEMGENLFVTNTITWMILKALHDGYTDIHLFGVHMAHETEYGYQQASCSWALGIIHGWMMAGYPYSLYIAEESELLTARYEYGYGEPTQAMQYLQRRKKSLQEGVKEAENRISDLERRKLMTEGAIQENEDVYKHLAGLK
jgi:hypothetical protein